ncbi:hypothetical protein ACLEPN_11405 [Myxococcus sp. 1LA]
MAPVLPWGVGLRGVLDPLTITAWVLLASGRAQALALLPGGGGEESAVMEAVSSGDAAGLTALLARGATQPPGYLTVHAQRLSTDVRERAGPRGADRASPRCGPSWSE